MTNSFTTPATGDSYIELADANAALGWSDSWNILTDPEKEALIVAASAMLDRRAFIGAKSNDPQPMAFPRTVDGAETDDAVFGIDAQKRATNIYVCTLIEYRLAKVHIGIQQYQLGDESIRHTAMIEPDEARLAMWDFLAK